MSTPTILTARGTFDVRLNPQAPDAEGGGPFGRLTGAVIPGSGTGELAGLSGRYAITVTGGQHRYELEYWVESRDE